ncbi:aldose epimerase [Mangrovactinospora gilvigrisea]|uniref:Aldose epimerase n=1 Tax=Mangrovactinospora gilvigrisea TaxID=1428644 RepID=A0A1J7BD51_9ACTN|nr:aldose epimerase [Mangrovactinospora gilvigrisea]OIV36574.1 aldose epimerase [Mangrovactinospora gilvigrisea]
MTSNPAPSGAPVTFTAGDAVLTVLPGDGCRIGGLTVGGVDIVRTTGRSLHQYGAFPMVPWVGRVRDGVFRSGGDTYQLPRTSGPNAIHGTATDHPWYRTGPTSFGMRLTDPWPFPGVVSQEFELSEEALRVNLMLEATGESFPAQLGWHPWFLRQLHRPDGTPIGEPARLDFSPEFQWERGEDHLPTGKRIAPLPGPWDDCFGMPGGVDALLTWPGALKLRITSPECDSVVVYDEQEDALAVEPQTGPPNGINTEPRTVTPVDPLEATMTWAWTSLS